MRQELRKKTILDLLKISDMISIQQIAETCEVSEITARRDLNELEEEGLIIRTHGGALKSEVAYNLFSFNNKLNRNKDNKVRICQKAAGFIQQGDILFVDCGSTLYHMSRYIRNLRDLKIITNSLPFISEIINYPNISITMVGGEIVNDRRAIYGPVAEKCIAEYHARKAFIGADGISLRKGLSSYDEKESSITRTMMDNSDEVYLVTDSSKLEKDSFIRFANISAIDYLITDSEADPEIIKKYRKNKINIII
ncbi:DeoR/GlpR family DNA-binding transcription regulator [Bacteroidota bacterium]